MPDLSYGTMEEAYFAGGCFWCMEKPYHLIEGVISAESGYSGGKETAPTYEAVKRQETGHRETVKIVFDPGVISFDELLRVYFESIDPFDGGGQFIDRGHSYTCAVYCTGAGQRKTVEEAIKKIEADYRKKVCVSVEDFAFFVRAEEYHQNYAAKNEEAYRTEYEVSGRAAVSENDRVKY
ncbi:MAG: peptide-methionine (S)-S-oxide reductase MsrA [Lachnospiraceae bacterium]|nr:peptide-methionine (S)-S-oxide reductase MsrA [Lachnospiraceae bacterium]